MDIQIADIGGELAKMADKPCLFNLVAYSQDPQRTAYLTEIVRAIAEKFPCRIIFIEGNPNCQEHFLHATVSRGIKDSPQLNIYASCNELHRVPFIVIPHLVTDLPIYLLWGHDPTMEKVILPKLEPYASRLLFDAEGSENIKKFSEEMLSEFDTLSVDFMDLNWGWISGWRDVISQVFNTPEKLSDLKHAKTIEITYHKVKDCAMTQAIYLQGWIVAQLGWKFVSKENEKTILTYTSRTGEHQILLIPTSTGEAPAGSISSFVVVVSNGNSYSIRKHATLPSQVLVHESTPITCNLPYALALPNSRRGFPFLKEIFYQQPSEHYRNMLEAITHINWNQHHA